jgi:hypothetical protein
MVPYHTLVQHRRSESYSHPTPLEDFRRSRRWPPKGYTSEDALEPDRAEDLICAGASSFKGYCDAIANAPAGYDRFYAVMESNGPCVFPTGRIPGHFAQHDGSI